MYNFLPRFLRENKRAAVSLPQAEGKLPPRRGKLRLRRAVKRGQWGFPKRSRKKFLSAQKFFREYNTHGVLPASIAGTGAFERMLARSRTTLLEKRPQVAANMRLMQER